MNSTSFYFTWFRKIFRIRNCILFMLFKIRFNWWCWRNNRFRNRGITTPQLKSKIKHKQFFIAHWLFSFSFSTLIRSFTNSFPFSLRTCRKRLISSRIKQVHTLTISGSQNRTNRHISFIIYILIIMITCLPKIQTRRIIIPHWNIPAMLTFINSLTITFGFNNI